MIDTVSRFSEAAGHYHHRWDYDPAAVAIICEQARGDDPLRVADIGAGTEILGRHFLERGCRVWAVEPNLAMREVAAAKLGHLSAYTLIDGPAEATTLPDRSVDVVVIGRAVDWFEPAATQAELRRILAPAGLLAIFRILHTDDRTRAAWQQLRTVENGWLAPCKGYNNALHNYYLGDHYQSHRFPCQINEDWEQFWGRICSISASLPPIILTIPVLYKMFVNFLIDLVAMAYLLLTLPLNCTWAI